MKMKFSLIIPITLNPSGTLRKVPMIRHPSDWSTIRVWATCFLMTAGIIYISGIVHWYVDFVNNKNNTMLITLFIGSTLLFFLRDLDGPMELTFFGFGTGIFLVAGLYFIPTLPALRGFHLGKIFFDVRKIENAYYPEEHVPHTIAHHIDPDRAVMRINATTSVFWISVREIVAWLNLRKKREHDTHFQLLGFVCLFTLVVVGFHQNHFNPPAKKVTPLEGSVLEDRYTPEGKYILPTVLVSPNTPPLYTPFSKNCVSVDPKYGAAIVMVIPITSSDYGDQERVLVAQNSAWTETTWGEIRSIRTLNSKGVFPKAVNLWVKPDPGVVREKLVCF